jgi:Cu/Ag efflux pump CusA
LCADQKEESAPAKWRASSDKAAAFILGLVPLVWAHGVAQISRRDIGTSVFAGMLVASTIGIFLIQMLYVVFQRLREWRPGRAARERNVVGHFPKRQREH